MELDWHISAKDGECFVDPFAALARAKSTPIHGVRDSCRSFSNVSADPLRGAIDFCCKHRRQFVAAPASLFLHTTDGTGGFALDVAAPRPGRDMLRAVLPWLGAVWTSLAVFVIFLARHGQHLAAVSQSAAATLAESHRLLEHRALHDPVTGLPNRSMFARRVQELLARSSAQATVLFLDLDHFKPINDTFGHNMGDQLLRKVANELRKYFLEARDIYQAGKILLARVGGDEFVAIIPGIESKQQASAIANGAIDVLRQPFTIGGSKINIGASVGITMFPEDARTYEDLLVNADLAMYAAKNKGRNTCMFYTTELATAARERLTLENELKEAIKKRALSVHYQPKCDCHDGRIRGVTPVSVGDLSPAEDVTVELRLRGYKVARKSLAWQGKRRLEVAIPLEKAR